MDGVTATGLLAVIRECFPGMSQGQGAMVFEELQRHSAEVGRLASALYVKGEPAFTVAGFIRVLRDCSARARPASPNLIAETKAQALRLAAASQVMRLMSPEELEQMKAQCLAAIDSPLRERLARIPAVELRSVRQLVAERLAASGRLGNVGEIGASKGQRAVGGNR